MNIEFRDLRFAVSAAEHHSLRRAAAALGMQPATLNRGVRRLEQWIGTPIFERQRNGVRPTVLGDVFLRSARRILEETDRLAAVFRNRVQLEEGRLCIGFATSLSAGNLRATLIDTERLSEANVTLVSGARAKLLAKIRNGAVDLAILPLEDGDWPESILPLWSERVVAILPKTHPLVGRDVLYWDDLATERFLFPASDPGPMLQRLLRERFTRPGRELSIVEHDVEWGHIKSLVGVGAGISLSCESSVGELHPGVVYREVRDIEGATRIQFGAFWRTDNNGEAMGMLLNSLHERYPDVGLSFGLEKAVQSLSCDHFGTGRASQLYRRSSSEQANDFNAHPPASPLQKPDRWR